MITPGMTTPVIITDPFTLTNINRALIIGATLNAAYVVVEFVLGFYYNSLALIADAGHNLSDVASLFIIVCWHFD